MDANSSWDNLPSVIIVEILSYLSVTEKTIATGTCRRWRNCLFHPSLWHSLDFKFKYGARKKARFLTDVVGRFVKEATIEFNSKFFGDVRDCLKLLQELGRNGNLEKLVLKPISFQVSWPSLEHRQGLERSRDLQVLYLETIDQIIRNSRHLRHISLGCIPELTDHADEILHLLEQHQYSAMEVLHIASVKEDPDSYSLLELPSQSLSCFENLHTLSIDYDYLSNDLLLQFVNIKGKVPLDSLILHVHGLEPGKEKITNATWARVVKANPNLRVTLSLVHSVDGCSNISDILQPSMPLVHFRMFFCQGLSVSGINFISRYMSGRLESLHIVDGLDQGEPMFYDFVEDEDPFVMLAWKCPNLKHFTLIGFDIGMEDIIAIARLRGTQLKTLYIPQCCISIIVESEEDPGMEARDMQLLAEVSSSLGRPWAPVPDDELPEAVLDPMADAESAYLSVLLSDQQ